MRPREQRILAAILAVAALALYANSRRNAARPRRGDIFDRADADGDGLLSRHEFTRAIELGEAAPFERSGPAAAAAAAGARPPGARRASRKAQLSLFDPQEKAQLTTEQARLKAQVASLEAALSKPAGSSQAAGLVLPQSAAASVDGVRPADAGLPQCSLVFFWHIVKTAGTTMRTVLQRNAQLGDFEYVYTDTTSKPRWQLLMHQLSHRVARRRLIVELHSEWGLGKDFHADIAHVRALYEPLGCTVTTATVVRQALSFHVAWFNWRASNHMPLCQWDPPDDPISRQLVGYSLPFVGPSVRHDQGGRRLRLPPSGVLSFLSKFDVVGTTERFDETLLVLGAATGLRHLGYARLAANQKPNHPRLAKALVAAMLADTGVASTAVAFAPRGANVSWRVSPRGGLKGALSVRWSAATLSAMDAYSELSMASALSRPLEKGQRPRADCNFYPCRAALTNAGGLVERAHCADTSASELLDGMLSRTATDGAVHAEAVRRLDAAVGALRRSSSVSVEALLEALRADSLDVQARRSAELGRGGPGLCGVRLCGEPLRSCVGCEANPVPGMEPCWPSWEDQFSPDERKLYCRRSSTHPGYDAAELKARTYPKVSPIPCWQTCWEAMEPNASAAHRVSPSCLATDAPAPALGGRAGPACARRKVHCTPSCGVPLALTLDAFWKRWKADNPYRSGEKKLGLECPCGRGG